MLCPVCKETELRISDRQGIEIDYCPQCRGVWLDRGELDKLIERGQREYSQPQTMPAAPATTNQPRPHEPHYQQPRYDKRRDDDDDDDYRRYGKRRKKGGWLGDLLDFD
jgi:Zn-finger nucleic acid-binding protein